MRIASSPCCATRVLMAILPPPYPTVSAEANLCGRSAVSPHSAVGSAVSLVLSRSRRAQEVVSTHEGVRGREHSQGCKRS